MRPTGVHSNPHAAAFPRALDLQEFEAIKSKLAEMEQEAEKLKKMQDEVEEQMLGPGGEAVDQAAQAAADELDQRSIYVGNVDYSATPEELHEHFQSVGTVNRVTILCDKYRNPKGYAYIEFAEKEAVETSLALNESIFKGRPLKITPKRTNVFGFNRGRGRGGYGPAPRGRGGGRGFHPYARGGGRGRGRRGGFRGGGGGGPAAGYY